jgi:hypothetical protein
MPFDPAADDVLEVAVRVGRALDSVGARYLLVGSVASSLLGDPRTTNDIDFVAALPAARVEAFREALGEEFDVDEAALADAMATGGSWNIFFSPWMSKVDLFAAGSSERQQVQFARAIRIPVGSGHLMVLSAEDAILSKLSWFRDGGGVSQQQWRDVLGVLRVAGTTLDSAYLSEWGERLGLQGLLANALAEAGS